MINLKTRSSMLLVLGLLSLCSAKVLRTSDQKQLEYLAASLEELQKNVTANVTASEEKEPTPPGDELPPPPPGEEPPLPPPGGELPIHKTELPPEVNNNLEILEKAVLEIEQYGEPGSTVAKKIKIPIDLIRQYFNGKAIKAVEIQEWAKILSLNVEKYNNETPLNKYLKKYTRESQPTEEELKSHPKALEKIFINKDFEELQALFSTKNIDQEFVEKITKGIVTFIEKCKKVFTAYKIEVQKKITTDTTTDTKKEEPKKNIKEIFEGAGGPSETGSSKEMLDKLKKENVIIKPKPVKISPKEKLRLIYNTEFLRMFADSTNNAALNNLITELQSLPPDGVIDEKIKTDITTYATEIIKSSKQNKSLQNIITTVQGFHKALDESTSIDKLDKLADFKSQEIDQLTKTIKKLDKSIKKLTYASKPDKNSITKLKEEKQKTEALLNKANFFLSLQKAVKPVNELINPTKGLTSKENAVLKALPTPGLLYTLNNSITLTEKLIDLLCFIDGCVASYNFSAVTFPQEISQIFSSNDSYKKRWENTPTKKDAEKFKDFALTNITLIQTYIGFTDKMTGRYKDPSSHHLAYGLGLAHNKLMHLFTDVKIETYEDIVDANGNLNLTLKNNLLKEALEIIKERKKKK